ncbi:glycosyltransferase family 4 protein [Photobacterium sanguinicancri]|uniref:Glycosyltransferase WbuB n=1 Tax=Photobacterium sanguinicancri TaxID=875932 RepID=A0ABX4FRU8_9GAMM|nr:glycosyltransferase family 4 protein [Photobacterium sanguinicancri]OZS41622.1 glycosyltransferase WbuB [Photobacterium sanguinicancri]
MNILYFHQHFSTPKGCVGIRSYEMAKNLIRHGHSVTMVCGSYNGGNTGLSVDFINGKREGIVDGIRVIEFNLAYSNSDGFLKRTFSFFKFAFKSIGLSLTEKYDIVFATTTPLTAGIPGIVARWCRGKKFVFEVRDLWPELPKAMGVIKNPLILAAMSLLEWVSYRSAHRCIGLSPGIVEGIKKRGVSADKIAMVPNGCDLTIFSDVVSPWRPNGVDDADFMAVFTGTHGIANGLDSALNAAKELQSRGRTDIKLVLIGQGKLKPTLEARAKSEGIDNIIFHEPVDKIKLAGLMRSANLGMQLLANVPAFYFGTSPNKFFDYIASGLPVLNNYPGWLAGMIEQSDCGFTVSPENPKAFADTLEKAADNPDLILEMGQNATLLAKNSFDRSKLADDWLQWVIEVD